MATAAVNSCWRDCGRSAGREFYVATKAGRRLDPHTAAGYNRQNLTAFIERSLKNLQTEAMDLLQLHCPPTEVYYMPEVFGVLDDLVKAGKLRHYGVSVEKVEEALKAIEFPERAERCRSSSTCFDSGRPNYFLVRRERRRVGILARVPLASGMLTGKFKRVQHVCDRRPSPRSIATAKRSTAAKPFPGWITKPGCRR